MQNVMGTTASAVANFDTKPGALGALGWSIVYSLIVGAAEGGDVLGGGLSSGVAGVGWR